MNSSIWTNPPQPTRAPLMRFPPRCFIALFFLPILLCHHADTTVTAQDSTLLKKRIEELETENKALRKIISEVQKAVTLQSSDSTF